MGVNSLPKTVTRFEPGPYCAVVQHANHSATGRGFENILNVSENKSSERKLSPIPFVSSAYYVEQPFEELVLRTF